MRDSRSLFLLIFSLVLVTISFILVSVWGYHFYFQQKDSPVDLHPLENNSLHKATATRDSLRTLLNATIEQLGDPQSQPHADKTDTLDQELESKILEYTRLKTEISEILKNKTSSSDMEMARTKIGELQQSINALRDQSNAVARENVRLHKMLSRLLAAGQSAPLDTKSPENNSPSISNTPGSIPLLVSHLVFEATDVDHKNTRVAASAHQLEGSFAINIRSQKNNEPDIYVVVLQPNGRVLLNSPWESGTFVTGSGSKTYSALVHFDPARDNNQRLRFSIEIQQMSKGKYTMQIYHNGILIGRLSRTLT